MLTTHANTLASLDWTRQQGDGWSHRASGRYSIQQDTRSRGYCSLLHRPTSRDYHLYLLDDGGTPSYIGTYGTWLAAETAAAAHAAGLDPHGMEAIHAYYERRPKRGAR
jgi:hypothetical protein